MPAQISDLFVDGERFDTRELLELLQRGRHQVLESAHLVERDTVHLQIGARIHPSYVALNERILNERHESRGAVVGATASAFIVRIARAHARSKPLRGAPELICAIGMPSLQRGLYCPTQPCDCIGTGTLIPTRLRARERPGNIAVVLFERIGDVVGTSGGSHYLHPLSSGRERDRSYEITDDPPTACVRAWAAAVSAAPLQVRLIVVAELPERTTEPAQDRQLSYTDTQRLLRAVLDRLDENKRAVFVLYELEELSMTEVAEAIGCPLQTGYSRLHAARDVVLKAALELRRGAAR